MFATATLLGIFRKAIPVCGISLAMAVPAWCADLTVALSANVNTLDPHKSTTVATELSVISHLYSSLVIRNPDLTLRPSLAKAWRNIDENTWRFELREGITFPDGTPLDAAAVKWNIDRVLDPAVGARMKPWLAAIKDVLVIDPLTIEIKTATPYPALANQLEMFFLLNPKWSATHNPAIEASGSGPYDLVEFRSGDHITLKAKANYWGTVPKFDKITFRIIPEESTRIASLLAGQVDFISGIPPSEIGRLNDGGKVVASAVPSTRFMMVKYNNLRAPFRDNVKLRQALNYAVDRQAIVNTLWAGHGTVAACQVLSPAYFGYNPDLKPYPYDPAKAKQLLAEAGFPKGLDLEMEIPLGRYLQSREVGEIVSAQLAKVGVRVTLREMEFGYWIDKYRIGRKLGDLAYFGLSWPTLDADGLLTFWMSNNDQSYYENPKVDELIKLGRSTVDPDKRLAYYKQVTQLMCDNPPHIFMFFQPLTYAHSTSVNWHARGDDWVRASDFELKN